MFAMFRQFFAMFSSLFSAGQRGANALDILAGSLEDTARVYADEASIDRQMRLITRQRDLRALEANRAEAATEATAA